MTDEAKNADGPISSSETKSNTGELIETSKTKPCPICREPIMLDARKCVHCSSVLDWTRFIGGSSTTLALLTALFAVMGQTAPAMRWFFEGKDSILHATFMGTGLGPEVLNGRLMSGHIVLLVSNSGTKAGGIVTGRLEVRWTADKRLHELSSALWTPMNEPFVVGPGGAISVRLFTDSKIDSGAGTDAADVQALVTPVEQGDPLTAPIEHAKCSIGMTLANASGSTEELVVPARCVAIHPILANAVQSTAQ